MTKQNYLKIIFILFILFAIIYFDVFINKKNSTELNNIQHVENCNNLVNQECFFELKQQKLSIQFDQEPTALKKFKIKLTSNHNNSKIIKKLTASFQMKNMDMGFNLFQFTPISNDNKTNHQYNYEWISNAILPVCTDYRNDWILILKITDSDQKEDVIHVTFKTKH